MSKGTGRGIISVVVGLALGEIFARLLLENDLLIPSFSRVLRSLWTLTMDGKLSRYLSTTFLESAYGFSTATVIGIIIGYFIRMHKWVDELMDPGIATRWA